MTRTEDILKSDRIYHKLLYYKKNKLEVFFKWKSPKNELVFFRRGVIIDLSYDKQILVLRERVLGTIPILLEEIEEDTITQAQVDK